MKRIILFLNVSCICLLITVSWIEIALAQAPSEDMPLPSISLPAEDMPLPKVPVENKPRQPSEGHQVDDAEVYYVVLCIENRMETDFEYSYKWEDSEWESVKINKKERKLHGVEYGEDAQPFPEFFIKFDDSTSDDTTSKEKSLDLYIAPENSCDYGNGYHFEVVEQRIELAED